jgi:toxin secretion/phage lysis holin
MLLVVLVACRLDLLLGSDFIRDAAVIAFAANETISIIENLALMGVPVPKVLTEAIEVLKKKSEK